MHIYQASPGSTLAAIGRLDRSIGSMGRRSSGHFHPLTPRAAGLLLREPRLGAAVPRAFMRTPRRIAAGQRLYVLQPLGQGAAAAPGGAVPTHAWLRVHYHRGSVTVGVYFSEAQAQQIAEAIRQGRGSTALLKSIVEACRRIGFGSIGRRVEREDKEEFEELAGWISRRIPRFAGRALRKHLAAWILPAFSKWAAANGEAFARAASHPGSGVTIRARVSSIPGFDLLRRLAAGGASADLAAVSRALRGSPSITFTITPGRGRA
jgi:hypothetical protein